MTPGLDDLLADIRADAGPVGSPATGPTEFRIGLVAVIGAGVMGQGIAQTVAASSVEVLLVERDETSLAAGLAAIRHALDAEITHWAMTESEKRSILSRIRGTSLLDEATGADLVIEAVTEEMTVKKTLFRALNERCDPATIFISNTSTLNLTELAQSSGRPDRVLGMHFLSPVPKVPLVELVRAMTTSDPTFARVRRFAQDTLGKTPVEVYEYPGFVTTRVIIPMLNEAMHVLMEGIATAEGIDTAMRLGYGFPLGPLALADRIGLDEVLKWMEALYRQLGEPRYRPTAILRKLVRERKLGRKTGEGFFVYDDTAARA